MHGVTMKQNKMFESSIIIINYFILINVYYNYIINAQYDYYSSNNNDLVEECDKEENVEVTGAATASRLKRIL